MDVAQLRAFLAVAEELHFGRAAERLHVAQPPLSRTIKQFERELGAPLFERSTRTVRLTTAGHALTAPAREVLDAVRRAERAVRLAEDGDLGLVRISFSGMSTHRLIARLARTVHQRRPGIQLEFHSQSFASSLMARLVDGETDIALGRWDRAHGEVHSRVVIRDALVVAVPTTHRLARASFVTGADLAAETFVSLPPFEGGVLHDRLLRLGGDHGFEPMVGQIAPETETALALVAAEVGCLLTFESVAQNSNHPHLAFVPLAEDALPPVDLKVAWRRDDESRALLAVVEQLLQLGYAGHL